MINSQREISTYHERMLSNVFNLDIIYHSGEEGLEDFGCDIKITSKLICPLSPKALYYSNHSFLLVVNFLLCSLYILPLYSINDDYSLFVSPENRIIPPKNHLTLQAINNDLSLKFTCYNFQKAFHYAMEG